MRCPSCGWRDDCPTCGKFNVEVSGTRTHARVQYLLRAHFALHNARRVVEEDSRVLADELSNLIRQLEEVMKVAVHIDPNA